jgi:hypothetical protein
MGRLDGAKWYGPDDRPHGPRECEVRGKARVQQLHLVGFTTDHRGLIFSVRRGARSGSYQIAVDDRLFEAVDDARAWLEEAAAAEGVEALLVSQRDQGPHSVLSVREVQNRLRQGRSIDAVAAEAGVEASWVARFAAPVLTELAEVVRTVRATRYVKQRTGTSAAPLGDSVYRNLVARGLTTPREEFDRAWSARQLADGIWLVSFRYHYRGRDVTVSWSYDETTRKVAARDRLATQLAFRPGGPPPPTRSKTVGAGAAAVADAAAEDGDRPANPAKAAAKRLAAARKAARAQMAADAKKNTRRNAAVARNAASRPLRPAPKPKPAPKPAVEDPVVEVKAPPQPKRPPKPKPMLAKNAPRPEPSPSPAEQQRRREPLRPDRPTGPAVPEREPRAPGSGPDGEWPVRRTLTATEPEPLSPAAGPTEAPVFRTDLVRPARDDLPSREARPVDAAEPAPDGRRRRLRAR